MTATSPAEWLSAGSLGLSAISLIRLALAFADADAAYFDPRPAVRRVLARQGVVDARHDLNWVAASVWHEARPVAVYALTVSRVAVHALAEFGRDIAALVLLLTTSPKGAL